jgi:tetratricopeptide (TPR) repeat protein
MSTRKCLPNSFSCYVSSYGACLVVAFLFLFLGCATTTKKTTDNNKIVERDLRPITKKNVSKQRKPQKTVRYVEVGREYRGSLSRKSLQRKENSSKTATSTTRKKTSTRTSSTKRTFPASAKGFRAEADRAYRDGQYHKALEFYLKVLRRDPMNGESRYNVGAVYLALGEYKKAVSSLTDALDFGFAADEVYYNLGMAYLGLGRRSSALKVWKTARKRGVRSAEIESALGFYLLDNRKLEKSREYFERAVAYDPNYPAAHNGLGVLALHEGQLNRAVQHWKRAEQAERSGKAISLRGFSLGALRADAATNQSIGIIVGPDLGVLAGRLQQAQELAYAGSPSEAKSILENLEGVESDNDSYWNLVGYVNALMGEYSSAEQNWRKALRLGSDDLSLFLNLASLEFAKQNTTEASNLIERVLIQEPQNGIALALKGDIALLQGEHRRAEQYYRESLRADRELLSALNNFGVLQARQQKYNDSLTLLREALEVSQGDPEIRYNLALVAILAGKLNEAEKHLMQVKDASPNDADVYLHLGYVVGTQGRYSKAEAYFKKAHSLDPESVLSLNNLGVVYQKTGKFDQAQHYYRQAIDIDPSFAQGYNNLGSVLLELGKEERAQQAYEKAVSLSAIDWESRRNLGHIYLNEKGYKKAAEHLQLALALKPQDPDILFDLALAYEKLGKRTESITFFQSFLESAEGDGSRAEQILRAERLLQRLRYP